ncbi:hypothetical protein KZ813_10820 [Sphingomonas sp. RHCKR7]|uniref:hypothetical protein n=1 Tax=Sphingomonas folli TaxID=2862497 RepID=UPI001CA538CA|nr:hypothetical protein [Sphingomonas folli]MBW6527333.1 hypothetical protein [Sphingomonas folli]
MGATTFTLRYEDLLAAARAGAAPRGQWRGAALIALPWLALTVALERGDLGPGGAGERGAIATALVLVALGWTVATLLVPLAARRRLVRRVRRRFARQPPTALLTTLVWCESGLVLASSRGTLRLGWGEVAAVEQGALLLFRRRGGGVPPFVPLALLTPTQRAELRALADGRHSGGRSER